MHASGLDHYYALATGTGTPGDAAPAEMPWLPALVAVAREGAADPKRVRLTLDVQGLHCAACVWLLQALFKRREGGHHLDVNPGLGRLVLTFDPARFDVAAFAADLARVGYRTGPPSRDARASAGDDLGVRLGVVFAIAMNAMALALARYFGLGADDPDGLHRLFGWVDLALSTAACAVAVPVFARGAWYGLKARDLHLDLPITIGVGLAWLGSVALFFGDRPDLAYFDTLDVFLALMLLGRWAQRSMLERSRRLLLEDDGLALARVRVVGEDHRIASLPLVDIRRGVRMLIAPGELMPVAGTMADGSEASFDLAWITGEPDAVAFGPGRTIPAGAHLVGLRARLVSASEPFASSALHDLIARQAAAPTSDRFWHRLTTGWVVTVLAFAAATALVWWSIDPSLALRHATAVLVVTCPCAIGLATPLAYELAQRRLQKLALLPRRAGLLDRARHLEHVVFDKTGTLTLTDLRLADPAALSALADEDLRALWQLTARSNHPKSRALQAELPPFVHDATFEVDEVPGRGLVAGDHTLVADGHALAFTRRGETLARFTFEESLRPEAKAEIARLTDAGLDVHIASGDAAPAVLAIARRLGIPDARVHAGMSPADKAALVERLGGARTMMIGDGINDAAAFERAAVSGTPAIDRPMLPARADFVLLGSGLGALAELVHVARATRRITLRNLWIAAGYNVLGLVAGLAGWLSPVVAAVAMPLSSLLVIALTLVASRPRRAAAQPTGAPSWMPST